MTGVLAILKRELRSLWVSPLAWVLLCSFLLLQGGIFYSITLHFSRMEQASAQSGPLNAYFGQQSLLMSFTLLLLCPSLTMRSLAEERRSGSIDLLLSAPITSGAIVVGKFLAIFVTYCLIWSPTVLYALLLRDTGSVHTPTLIVSYLGVALLGASYLSIGVLMSALAKSQLIALLLTTSSLFGLFVLAIGEYIFDAGILRDLSAYLSITHLLEETAKGIVDSRRLVLHGSITLWCLFVSTRLVESWRSP